MRASIRQPSHPLSTRSRLQTVIECIMDKISFDAPDMEPGAVVTVDKALVRERIEPFLEKANLSKFIL